MQNNEELLTRFARTISANQRQYTSYGYKNSKRTCRYCCARYGVDENGRESIHISQDHIKHKENCVAVLADNFLDKQPTTTQDTE